MHRRLTVLAATAAAALILTGCSTQSEQPATPSKTATSAPAAAADMHVGKDLQLTGEAVTDEHGVYKKVELADDAAALKALDAVSVTDLSSYNQADAVGAMKYALRFEADQGIDSIALDTGDAGWEKWKSDVGPDYAFNDDVLDRARTDKGTYVTVVNAELFGSFPTTIRDGGPRMTADTTLSVKSASEYVGDDNVPMMSVVGETSVPYRVTPGEARQVLKDGTDLKTNAAIDERYPFMASAKEVSMLVKQQWTLNLAAVSGNGGWRIAGYKVQNTGDFAE